MSLQQFLDFWSNPPAPYRSDPIKAIYQAYGATQSEIAELKSQGRQYIVPAKDSRGRWIPVFDEGKTDDIALLASQIEAANSKLKSISDDVETVCNLAGACSMVELVTKHEQTRHSVQLAETAAGAAMRRAINGRGRTTAPPRPDEIATRPEIVEIYAKADILRAELTPKIEEMAGRLDKIRTILEKYS
jgi:hypothetical protein